MRRRRAGVVLAVALLAACGGSGDDDSSDGDSNTPHVTVDEEQSDASDVLLEPEDLDGLRGFAELEAQDINDLPLFENPDTRGPCGGAVPAAPLEGAVGRAFVSDSQSVVELVVAATAETTAFVEAVVEDSHAAVCEPYDSQTNTGATQHVSNIRIIDVSGVDDLAAAWTSTITVEGQGGPGGAMTLGSDGWFALIQFYGSSLPPEASIVELAERAAARLGG